MGQRSSTETVIALLQAFLKQRTWKQVDLARHVGTSAGTIHKRLVELCEQGVPLESEKEHPHVWWSVPKSWFPGGLLLDSAQATELLRLLSRLPKGRARDRLLEHVLEALPTGHRASAVMAPVATSREDEFLPVIEDAAQEHAALQFRYFTAGKGTERLRLASPHVVVSQTPARFLATCHKDETLKWFRVDGVSEAKLTAHESFRSATKATIDKHVRESLNGFHEGGASERSAFFVSLPDARWVSRNLLAGMDSEDVPGGIRVTVQSAALNQVARFVVGLGESAKPLTPRLEAAVTALAQGALRAIHGLESIAPSTRTQPSTHP